MALICDLVNSGNTSLDGPSILVVAFLSGTSVMHTVRQVVSGASHHSISGFVFVKGRVHFVVGLFLLSTSTSVALWRNGGCCLSSSSLLGGTVQHF